MTGTFRFDDISINTDLDRLGALIHIIREYEPDIEILLAISPIVFGQHQLEMKHAQRVHPPTLTAMSELHPYYKGETCGLPVLPKADYITRAGHGLVHVDHRLLNYQAQELSIVASCALAQAHTFVPPYNHWNKDTEAICDEHEIALIKFEEGWKHALWNVYEPIYELWYCHPYDFTPAQLKAWFMK